MPVIVDASTQGKVKFPAMPNVVSRNDSTAHMQTPSGVSKMTAQNVDKMQTSKGKPNHLGAATSGLRSQIAAQQSASSRAIKGLSESTKGVYVSTIG